ncbi:hypothetical protein LVJ94_25830 [Pendulispora rubella]|uniref:Uncharacterized protein n=1 Tax=Pendulispora rubella TaxID=2741070 RepID=A0ABZ2LLZ9_9BACT
MWQYAAGNAPHVELRGRQTNVVADIAFSPDGSEMHLQSFATLDQSLEQLVLALEEAAFRLLEHENDAYIAGDFAEVMKFAKWRNDLRRVADALSVAPNVARQLQPNGRNTFVHSLGPDESGVRPIPALALGGAAVGIRARLGQ